MVQAVQYNIGGLKCDAHGCDYRDDDAKFEDYDKYLNAPCPKCGASLLTEADLAAVKAMIAGAEWLNKLVGDVPDEGQLRFAIDMDGSGVPKPRVIEPGDTR